MLIPIDNQIIVRRDKSQDMTKGGIALPTQSQEKPQIGTIVAVGQAVNDDLIGTATITDPAWLKEGDRIIFRQWSADVIEHEGEELLFMPRANILAKFPTESKKKK